MYNIIYCFLFALLSIAATVLHAAAYFSGMKDKPWWAMFTLLLAAYWIYRTIRTLRKGSKEISW